MNDAVQQLAVQQLLDQVVASGEEVGLQVAVYVGNEQVVDAWAGLADEATGRRVDGDTLFTSWSTTKGFAATCLHILADRGRVEYEMPVARYWPEFAAHGKDAVTVRHVLTHMAGVPQMPDEASPEMICDWDAMCRAIAGQKPLWPAGTQTGYHAWTIGWIVGEIIRRVDGRPIAQFIQEELCRPLGIASFYLGIPKEVESRVATLRHAPALPDAVAPNALNLTVMPPYITHADILNRPDIRQASIPGGGGIMNARAIARHYAMLANGGELDGVRILSPGRIDRMREMQTDDHDIVIDRRIRKSMGYFLGGDDSVGGVPAMGPTGHEFGHPGLGGSLGFADPERKLAFGLTKTLLKVIPDPRDAIAYRAAEVVREQLSAGVGG
jgi:CubicO group peptidase (beta-lactamase class C family)